MAPHDHLDASYMRRHYRARHIVQVLTDSTVDAGEYDLDLTREEQLISTIGQTMERTLGSDSGCIMSYTYAIIGRTQDVLGSFTLQAVVYVKLPYREPATVVDPQTDLTPRIVDEGRKLHLGPPWRARRKITGICSSSSPVNRACGAAQYLECFFVGACEVEQFGLTEVAECLVKQGKDS